MHSYSNGTSLQTKLGNWQLLEKVNKRWLKLSDKQYLEQFFSQCFEKEKLDIPKAFVEGTIHCKPGAAIALLEKLYIQLTNRE